MFHFSYTHTHTHGNTQVTVLIVENTFYCVHQVYSKMSQNTYGAMVTIEKQSVS